MQYFSRKDKLVEHKKEVHNGQKFKCKASFTQKDKLKNHFKMGQHKKSLSLHECSICGMKFQRWQERDRHIKEIHSQKKKVKCPECNQIIHRCISVTKCLPTQALSGAMRNKSMQNLASSAKNVQQPTPKLEKHVASGNKSQCRLLLWLLLAFKSMSAPQYFQPYHVIMSLLHPLLLANEIYTALRHVQSI